MKKKVGDKVAIGDILCVLHTNLSHSAEAEKIALEAYGIGSTEKKITKYIYQIIQ